MTPRALIPAFLAIALPACGGGGDGSGVPPPFPGIPPAARASRRPGFREPDFRLAGRDEAGAGRRLALVRGRAGGSHPRVRERIRSPRRPRTSWTSGRACISAAKPACWAWPSIPDFAANGRVYLNFSEHVGGVVRSVTAEFTSPDGGLTLDPASERVLLTVPKPAGNHNGGNLAFGRNGFLYIGLGDGGGSGDPNGNAQNPARLLGKMLRIDVDSQPGGAPYAIPGGIRREPLRRQSALQCQTARGRCNAQRSTHLDFAIRGAGVSTCRTATCGSATSGQGSFEEIDLIERGANYGWDVREGAHCFEPSSGCADRGPHGPGCGIRPRPGILDHRRICVPRDPADLGRRPLRLRRTSAA